MTPSAAAAMDNFYEYAKAVVEMQLPEYFYTMWVAGRMLYPDDMIPGAVPDCRPVNIGYAERRLITHAYFDDDLKDTYIDILGPVQNGCIPGGISITALGAQVALNATPEFGITKGDIKNGYNEVKRESVLKAMMRALGKLGHTLSFMYALMKPTAYIGLGAGTRMTTAPFKCSEGQHQGSIESGWLFFFLQLMMHFKDTIQGYS